MTIKQEDLEFIFEKLSDCGEMTLAQIHAALSEHMFPGRTSMKLLMWLLMPSRRAIQRRLSQLASISSRIIVVMCSSPKGVTIREEVVYRLSDAARQSVAQCRA